MRNSDYWRRVARDATKARWSKLHWRGALLCLPVIAAWVFVGVLRSDDSRVVFAVAGAVSVAFGAFQRLGHGRVRPLLVLLAGLGIGTWAGDVAGHLGWPVWVILITACGFGFGAMTMLGYGGWWLGLQWMIALVVFGSRSLAPKQAAVAALAVVAGGASELFFLAVFRPISSHWFSPQDQPPFEPFDSLRKATLKNMDVRTPGGQYALRVAAAMAITTLVAQVWGLANGYWMPMTAAILLKPDFHEATIRGINRVVGTAAGAGLMTIVIALAQPGPGILGIILLLAVGACLALMRVNYALFVVCITAYVVLLFSALGLPEPIVALHRVEATLVGATVALIVSLRGWTKLGPHMMAEQ